MTPIEKVRKARDKDRLKIQDYIDNLFTDFFEQKGDRLGKEDESIIGGIALFNDTPVTIIGHRKGKDVKENIKYNFGMAGPEGYRKAKRIMEQAVKFRRPIITFVDTPGAYPGLEAEMNGQAKAIADNLAFMSTLDVPVLSIVTGEGSSGGALGIAMGNKVYMLENSVYSILSPEGFASILWHDAGKSERAAKIMKLTPEDLLELGLIDGIIEEDKLLDNLKEVISDFLNSEQKKKPEQIKQERYEKYRYFDERFLKIYDRNKNIVNG